MTFLGVLRDAKSPIVGSRRSVLGNAHWPVIANRLWSRHLEEAFGPTVKNFFVASDGVRIPPSASMRAV